MCHCSKLEARVLLEALVMERLMGHSSYSLGFLLYLAAGDCCGSGLIFEFPVKEGLYSVRSESSYLESRVGGGRGIIGCWMLFLT